MHMRLKPSVASARRVDYLRLDGSKWVRSAMPPDVADELLARLDWEVLGTEAVDAGGTMRIPTSFLEADHA